MLFARETRDLAHVPRWSIVRTIRQQYVAEHCFFVAMYADQIATLIQWNQTNDTALYRLLVAALWHDAEECATGDIPGPTKRNLVSEADYYKLKNRILADRFGSIQMLDDAQGREIKSILKTANLMDETLYLAGELQMGNAAVRAAYQGSRHRLFESITLLPCSEVNKISMAREAMIAIQRELSGESLLPHNNSDLREETRNGGVAVGG